VLDEWKDYKFEKMYDFQLSTTWFFGKEPSALIDRAKSIKFFENTVRSAKGRVLVWGVLGMAYIFAICELTLHWHTCKTLMIPDCTQFTGRGALKASREQAELYENLNGAKVQIETYLSIF
jgi:hypothetical protein